MAAFVSNIPGVGNGWGIRRPRLWWFSIGLFILLALANHGEYQLRQSHHMAAAPSHASQVRMERGPGGHATIGVVEANNTTDKNASENPLTFAMLGTWSYHQESPSPCPPAIQAHHGGSISLIGFMYPLTQGEMVRTFCLLRSTQTCCFGPRPQFNQYLFVETRDPVPFTRLKPIAVSGKFQVDPQPKQGYIYRVEDAVVSPVGDDVAPIDAHAYAQAQNISLWTWDALENISRAPDAVLPPALLARDGEQAVIDGFLLESNPGPPAQFMIGRYPPLGRPEGRSSAITNAITVQLQPGAQLPPLWSERVTWQGTVRIIRSSAQWGDVGVVRLENARQCGVESIAMGSGDLIVSVWAEIAIVCVLVFATWGRKIRAPLQKE